MSLRDYFYAGALNGKMVRPCVAIGLITQEAGIANASHRHHLALPKVTSEITSAAGSHKSVTRSDILVPDDTTPRL
jgi:hypothetical protein